MIKKLLVPLDNSALAEHALPTAESLARQTGAAVELVYVHEPHPVGGYPDAPWNAARRTLEDAYIHGLAEEVRAGSGLVVTSRVALGSAADAICAAASDAGADLIVMTTHGHTGLSRAWLGSVADTVVRQSPIPVLLLRPEWPVAGGRRQRPSFAQVLVALDGTPGETAILQSALELARLDKGTLILLQIVAPVAMVTADGTVSLSARPILTAPVDAAATDEVVAIAVERLAHIAEGLTAEGGTRIETCVIASEFPAQAIINATHAHDARVVAMATTGGGVSRLLIGSITDKVMRASFLPLLLFRPQADAGGIHDGESRFALQPEHV